jgi:hypothetical protein
VVTDHRDQNAAGDQVLLSNAVLCRRRSDYATGAAGR